MNAFLAFAQKELLESWRTWRGVILVLVLALLGILSPLLALLTPAILGSVEMGGIVLEIPEPTALDAWGQFFSNVGQMGMLTLIIIFSGIMANEFQKGTLVNLLTKGMSRSAVILAKSAVAALLWSVAYFLSFGISLAYIAYYWELGSLDALPFVGIWLFGLLLIALLVFGGALFKSFYGSLALCGTVLVILLLLNIAPAVRDYNPLSLAGDTLAVLSGNKQAVDFLPALVITTTTTLALLGAAIVVFKQKQL